MKEVVDTGVVGVASAKLLLLLPVGSCVVDPVAVELLLLLLLLAGICVVDSVEVELLLLLAGSCVVDSVAVEVLLLLLLMLFCCWSSSSWDHSRHNNSASGSKAY
jgi:hypothetical protein